MPRKVTPRWGEPDVDKLKVPRFTLDDEQVAEFGKHLDVGGSEPLALLKAKLEWIRARYLLWIQQDEKGPSQADRNAALKKVLASPQELERNLALLDYATQGELLDELWASLLARGEKLG